MNATLPELFTAVRAHVPPPLGRFVAPPPDRGLEGYGIHLVPRADPGTPGLDFTWLGVAGLRVSDGTTSLLIDPMVSRPGLVRVFGGLGLSPDLERVRRWIGWTGASPCAAVLVSHTHFDHALDAPTFARETGAVLVGSESTANVGRGADLSEDQIRVVQDRAPLRFGDFTVTFLESAHGRPFRDKVPFPGTIDAPLRLPAPARAFREGGTWAIHVQHPTGSFVHHGSAATLRGTFSGITADTLFLALAGRGDDDALLKETARAIRARTLVPTHFDDFFLPLEDPIRPFAGVRLDAFLDTAARAGLRVATLPLGEPRRL